MFPTQLDSALRSVILELVLDHPGGTGVLGTRKILSSGMRYMGLSVLDLTPNM
jgi:hypothetical protein